MPRLNLTGEEVIAILLGYGLVLLRHDGTSHRRYRGTREREGLFVDIAVHRLSDDIPTGTLQSIIRQNGLPRRAFRR